MKYFNNIKSFSDLKKRYRKLVLDNHPDKGGATQTMQEINKEFEQLYNVWKDRKETEDNTGYANDYEGATAKQYTQHVYEEYGWTGSRRDRYYSRKELKDIFVKWLKETYKGCTFSISLSDYNSIVINLLKADFNPFLNEMLYNYSLSRYDIHDDPKLNARAKDMFNNIQAFCQSYNYDHSDLYSDYYDVGFYLKMNIGTGKAPFKVEIPKSRRASGSCAPEFKYKEGPAHQTIKKVLGKQFFGNITLYRGFHKGEHMVLGENYCYRDGDICFRGLQYSGYTTQAKKIEKLLSAGIIAECLGAYIKFVGYTPEVEKALAEEDRAKEEAYKRWKEEQAKGTAGKSHKENTAYGDGEKSLFSDGQESEKIGAFELVNYSEKAFAVVGDTREIKDLLKGNGGRFNPSLTVNGVKCAGWIFSKKSLQAVRLALIGYTVQDITVDQEQPEQEQAQTIEPDKENTSYGDGEKSLIFFNALVTFLDAVQEVMKEQPEEEQPEEEKQPEPEDIAKVLEVFPALLDAVCEIMKAEPGKEPRNKEREQGTNEIYNSVCSSAILSGEYMAARREIKEAVSRYRFTLPQLKYLIYILNTHPGIKRESHRKAA